MGKRRIMRWEIMDKSSTDLSVAMRHFEVHNRTEGKSIRTVEWYNEVLGLLPLVHLCLPGVPWLQSHVSLLAQSTRPRTSTRLMSSSLARRISLNRRTSISVYKFSRQNGESASLKDKGYARGLVGRFGRCR